MDNIARLRLNTNKKYGRFGCDNTYSLIWKGQRSQTRARLWEYAFLCTLAVVLWWQQIGIPVALLPLPLSPSHTHSMPCVPVSLLRT